MENVHRNDALKFFESMTVEEQNKAICYLQKIIKKPPDSDADKSESEVIHISQLCVK